MSMGSQHGCAWFDDGRVTCWGDSSHGQLGHEAPRDAFQLRTVSGVPSLVEVASAGEYSCGRTAAGNVWCWGDNGMAQLGTPALDPAPREVPGVADVVALELSQRRACARLTRGEVVCWGDLGGCVDATTASPPVRVAELDASLQLAHASGGCFGCRLDPKLELECGPSPYRQRAVSMSGISAVQAGSDHVCVIRLDGTVWCFGTSVRGGLGRRTKCRTRSDPRCRAMAQRRRRSTNVKRTRRLAFLALRSMPRARAARVAPSGGAGPTRRPRSPRWWRRLARHASTGL